METIIEVIPNFMEITSRNGRHDLTVQAGHNHFNMCFERVSTPFSKNICILFDDVNTIREIVKSSGKGLYKSLEMLYRLDASGTYFLDDKPVVVFENLAKDGSIGTPIFEKHLIEKLLRKMEDRMLEFEKFEFKRLALGIEHCLGKLVKTKEEHVGEWFGVSGIYVEGDEVLYALAGLKRLYKASEIGTTDA